ncbi:MAG: hypothetical protein R3E91_03005 [Chlamydiales bacterium]
MIKLVRIMTLLAVTQINGFPPIPRETVLRRNEKIAVITDFFIGMLLVIVGSLSLIQQGGLGNLGAFSSLGTVSFPGALSMVTIGFLLPTSNFFFFIVRESKYMRRARERLVKFKMEEEEPSGDPKIQESIDNLESKKQDLLDDIRNLEQDKELYEQNLEVLKKQIRIFSLKKRHLTKSFDNLANKNLNKESLVNTASKKAPYSILRKESDLSNQDHKRYQMIPQNSIKVTRSNELLYLWNDKIEGQKKVNWSNERQETLSNHDLTSSRVTFAPSFSNSEQGVENPFSQVIKKKSQFCQNQSLESMGNESESL